MAELLLLHEVFEHVAGQTRINLKSLYDEFYNPILAPYLGDFDSFMTMFYRLNQEGVLKSRTEGDDLIIEHVSTASPVHKKIKQLLETTRSCATAEEFESRVHVSSLNRDFMDAEEIKAVFYHLEGVKSAKQSTPTERQGEASDYARTATEKGMTSKMQTKADAMKEVYEKKVAKLKSMAKDNVEILLSKENEMDIAVIRYLLNDLMPLRDLKLNADELVLDAIKARGLPFVLDGTIIKRQGSMIKQTRPELVHDMRSALQKLALVISRQLLETQHISMVELQRVLDAQNFTIPESETLETLIEQAIKHGYFNGFIDSVEQLVYRPKNEQERQQEAFMREINKLSKEIAVDAGRLADLKKVEAKIPPGLDALLLSPKMHDLAEVLDKTEKSSRSIESFIMSAVKIGRKVSITDLSKQLKDHVHHEHVDVPFPIDDSTTGKILEKMVDTLKIYGYFDSSSNFIRRK
jgi:undecaprenyl pyrophosphate synthase